jgi:hypothetical protein
MSIYNRNALKAEFQTGNQATQASFADMIDSAYNKYEDSVLLGPIGVTGSYGLLGPTGGTFIGTYIISTVPGSTNSPGATGQIAFQNNVGGTGSTGVNMYIHNGSQWFKFSGTNTF